MEATLKVIEIVRRVRDAKDSRDYTTANKLTAVLLGRWMNWRSSPTIEGPVFLRYERSTDDLYENDPYYDLIAIGTKDEKVFLPLPKLAPTAIVVIFQEKEMVSPYVEFGLRGEHASRIGEPRERPELLLGLELEIDRYKWLVRD